MACLIVAGEAVFALPFHVARFFRPTLLEVFGYTNTQLGAIQAVYGVTAMLSYFPGGPLADRFSARRLLAGSLVLTGLGGFYFATVPTFRGMQWLFGCFGVTSVLLFWAALIRATRDWGGRREQGRAYGILDGGRGLFAAAFAAAAVVLFQFLMPDDPTAATDHERLLALRGIVLAYTATTLAAAGLVWLFVPEDPAAPASRRATRVFGNLGAVIRLPGVWLQALIVVCAYVGYKGIDQYSLFAVDGYGMNEVEGARLAAVGAWARPVAAVAAGFLGDRFQSSRVIAASFGVLIASYLFFALAPPDPDTAWILFANVIVSCAAVYGLRGVYFALLQEGAVPMAVTGAAVGLVSVIGYTPDVFVSVVAGLLIDRSPGVAGHQHFFLFLAAFASTGLVATVAFRRWCAGRAEPSLRPAAAPAG